jgi:rod shape-determining protein MreC
MKMAKETIKVLLEEKKITKETRIKIEAENISLKNKIINLQNTALIAKKIIKKNETRRKELEFLELNILNGRKCKKTIFNKLYTVGSQEYKACILRKGLKKN